MSLIIADKNNWLRSSANFTKLLFLIGLFTVFAAILSSRQNGSKEESLYGNSSSNDFNNTLVLKKVMN